MMDDDLHLGMDYGRWKLLQLLELHRNIMFQQCAALQ